MRLLTTSEAAEYLRLKERKLYELVADNAVPCTKVTGKWLFPKDELDRWLRGSLIRPDGMVRTDPMPIVGGTPDLLLEWSLLESASGLAMLPEGAEPGLRRFIRGELVATALNLQAIDADDLDGNINIMQSEANLHDAVLIGFSKREVGLVVAEGNPLGLASVTDIPLRAARIAAQPDGSGPQILLERLLKRADVAPGQVTFASSVCPTGPDVAQAVRLGRADCGLAIRAIANAIGLSFIPIAWERFDLVVRQHDYFRPQLQTFLRFLRSQALAARASEMGGYDISGIGEVRFAP